MRPTARAASRVVSLLLFVLASRPLLGQATPSGSVVTPASPTPAQAAAAAATGGRQVTNGEIADAIKKSGMSEDQVRERVRAAGYDPKLADPFFSGGASNADAASAAASTSFVNALQQMGILQASEQANNEEDGVNKLNRDTQMRPSSAVFGKNIFSAKATAFDPTTSGPLDPSYRVGTGDQLQVIFTGDIERAFTLDIRRDGTVVLPQVGQLSVAGLTLDAVRSLMKVRAANYFSGVSSGRVHLDVSIGRIRSIEVYVIGEVETPGAYQLSALGTVFQALARAGGPTTNGSFRDVELRRGSSVVAHFDLYDYLLAGDKSSDARLQQGDVVFVPLNTRAVAFMGAVRRPGIFELKPNESFSDLLRFAGGLQPTAAHDRFQLDRILPPSARTPGRDRVLMDVRASGDLGTLDTLRLHENDVVTAFAIGALRRNTISITGEVQEPGVYEWHDSLTLRQLVEKAQGLAPWALRDRVKILRTEPLSGRREIYSVSLDSNHGADFRLNEFDEVTVLDGRLAYPSGTVLVEGAVTRPGRRPHAQGLTLRDVIDLAGGFSERATSIEVARRVVRPGYTDTTSVIYPFRLGPNRELDSASARFVLERGDEIAVRTTPGGRDFGSVTVRGLFSYPGSYAVRRDDERLLEIVKRAGGVLPTASHETFRVIRDGHPVAIDYEALLRGDHEANIAVRPSDEIVIDNDPAVVLVSGAVERHVAVPFRKDWTVEDYLDAAGGVKENGERKKILVEYAGGGIARSRKTLFWLHDPTVRPGSTITVAEKPPEKEGAWRETLTLTSQLVSVFGTLALAFAALRR